MNQNKNGPTIRIRKYHSILPGALQWGLGAWWLYPYHTHVYAIENSFASIFHTFSWASLTKRLIWGAVLVFIPYLRISINHLWICIIYLRISISKFWISTNHFWISINLFWISINHFWIFINQLNIGYPKISLYLWISIIHFWISIIYFWISLNKMNIGYP